MFNLKNQSTTALFAKKLVEGGEIQKVIYSLFSTFDTNLWLRGLGE